MFSSYSPLKGTAALLDLCIYCDFVCCFEYMPYWLVNCIMKFPVAGITLSNGLVKWKFSVMSNSLRPHGLYSPWNSPGQNNGLGGLSLLQGIFPTQESNRRLLHCRWILHQLRYQGSSFTACFGLQDYFIQFCVTQEIAIECISLHLCCHSAHS